MTEAEWLTATDTTTLWDFVRYRAGSRKCRLYACACCRRVMSTVWAEHRHAREVEAVERFADGLPGEDLDAVRTKWPWGFSLDLGQACEPDDLTWVAEDNVAEATAQIALLRDIFGNPFRPVAVDPSWLTSTAVGIAQGIYDDKAFDRLPILADALQDAGCENAEILNHCRQLGEHVRGCWVVDLLTGRS